MTVPTSTYRLQFSPSFMFTDALGVVDYLADLGISTLYASPIFMSRPGSTHGYDVIDPNAINPELGTEREFHALAHAVNKRGMGWLQDIVPNHMAYDTHNRMLMDVLENGSASPYFAFFDVDWNHPYESMRGKVLAPFLGKFYGECLESGEIRLAYDEDGLTVNYYDLSFPLRIESYAKIFTSNLKDLKKKLGRDNPDALKLLGAQYALRNLPAADESTERTDQIRFIKKLLWELYRDNARIREFVDETILRMNGKKGVPESFNLLDELLTEQYFRLSFWKVATEEINYRRFFNINQLISVRVEDEHVWKATHALTLKLVRERLVTGLRIDHIDGLYDPKQYIGRLRNAAGDIYLAAEKILQPDEELPEDWSVQGTTGYDFLNAVNGILCERRNEKRFEKIYEKFTGTRIPFDVLVVEKKRLMIGKHMAGDVDRLAHTMKSVTNRMRYGSDITMYGLRRALVEVLAWFPVYRTYIHAGTLGRNDRHYVEEAIEKAKHTNPAFTRELEVIGRFLLLDYFEYLSDLERSRWLDFVMRFQQATGPLMAKGFEDTVLYIYNRLISLNDVGEHPNKFGISPVEFHYFNKKRAAQWPLTMNATSTHDTKRGEDVRARITVLSELPDEWERKIKTWSRMNADKKAKAGILSIPDANDEYFFYQTLVGVFPFFEHEYAQLPGRIKAYMIKAVREAKVHTAWLKPDEEYEGGFQAFVEKVLSVDGENHFLRDFIPFQKKIAHYGIFNSLSQTLLKVACPGIPDFYQGSELWDLNLVDPDNRRPVDFAERKRHLTEMHTCVKQDLPSYLADIVSRKEDGRINLYTIFKGLKARNDRSELFLSGDYQPLTVSGPHRNQVLAFARRVHDAWLVCIAPRLLVSLIKQDEAPLGSVWGDTAVDLPAHAPAVWENVFTEQPLESNTTLRLSTILATFPLGLLLSKP